MEVQLLLQNQVQIHPSDLRESGQGEPPTQPYASHGEQKTEFVFFASG